MTPRWDAIVIGGGPAGCSFATTLAGGGRRVLLLESERFPREHVGEALSPTACKLLDTLGAGGEVRAAGFVPRGGATFVWGRERDPWSVYYGAPGGAPAALQARRPELDAILLRHAAERGVEVREGCHVQQILVDAGRPVGVNVRTGTGSAERLHAPWIVDASGQDAVLARRLGLIEFEPRLRNSAVWSYWSGAGRLPGKDAGNSLFVGDARWCAWYAPLDERGGAGVGLVVPPSGWDGLKGDAAGFYLAAVAGSEVIADLLAGAEQVAPVRVAPASAYRATRFAGRGWLLVGDAACFVDPILFPGVQLAVEQGIVAAQVVETALADPASTDGALACYDQGYRRQYETFVQLALNLYGAARAPAPDAGLAPDAGPAATGAVPAAGNGSTGAPPTPPAPGPHGPPVPPGQGPPGQGGPADAGDRLAFLSLISGLPRAELPKHLGRYLALRNRAATMGGPAPSFGEEEGFSFLTHRFHAPRLRAARKAGTAGRLGADTLVRRANGAGIGDELFLPDGGQGRLLRRRAAFNRLGDRFEAGPALTALLGILAGGPVAQAELRDRCCAALGLDPSGQEEAFQRWLELLADNALVEWGTARGGTAVGGTAPGDAAVAVGRPSGGATAGGAPCAG